MVTMYPPQQVDAVLFDMDGTLLNTLPAWCVASEHLWGTSPVSYTNMTLPTKAKV